MESVSLVRDRMEPAAAAAAAAKSSTLPLPKEQRPAAAAAAAAAAPAQRSSEDKTNTNTTSEDETAGAAKKRIGSDEKVDGAKEAKSPAAARRRGSDEKAEAKSPAMTAAGRKVSAERLEDAPPIPCTHLKPSKEGVGKSKFDFSVVCRKSRVAQLSAITAQMYVIHSEWDRIGNFHFVLLFVALATHGINTFMRWRDAIDGRFDLKQIFLCSSNNLRVQYALAVLSGPLLALFTYWFLIPQKISLVHATLYSIAAFIKMIFAVGCFVLEAMEVSRDTLKPQVHYVKSFFY